MTRTPTPGGGFPVASKSETEPTSTSAPGISFHATIRSSLRLTYDIMILFFLPDLKFRCQPEPGARST